MSSNSFVRRHQHLLLLILQQHPAGQGNLHSLFRLRQVRPVHCLHYHQIRHRLRLMTELSCFPFGLRHRRLIRHRLQYRLFRFLHDNHHGHRHHRHRQ